MTSKGQMKAAFKVSFKFPGKREQPKAMPTTSIVSNILTNLISRSNHNWRTTLSGPTIESAEQPSLSTEFQNSKWTQPSWTTTKFSNLESWGLKTKLFFCPYDEDQIHVIPWSPLIKTLNQTTSNLNVESRLASTKLLTNRSDYWPNITIQGDPTQIPLCKLGSAIFAWQCVVWLAQHAKTWYKIWYLWPLPNANYIVKKWWISVAWAER